MARKVGLLLFIVILLGISVRWLGMVFDVCFAGLLVLFVYLLLTKKKVTKKK